MRAPTLGSLDLVLDFEKNDNVLQDEPIFFPENEPLRHLSEASVAMDFAGRSYDEEFEGTKTKYGGPVNAAIGSFLIAFFCS